MVMPLTASAADLARTRAAISAEFLILGAGAGVWAVHIPVVQNRLSIDPATIGMALLTFAFGAILTMPLTGAAVTRWGSRLPTAVLGIAQPICMVVVVLSTDVPMLFVASFVSGIASGGLDVAMNTQAAEFEIARRRPLMSSFHAFFSVGALVGSAAAGGLIALGLEHGGAAVVTGAVALGVGVVSTFFLWQGEPPAESAPRLSLPPPVLLGLGFVTFLAFAAEGAVADWSALYLNTERGASVAEAASGFIAFSVIMVIARLTGDRVVARLGPVKTLLWGGVVTAAGFVVAIFAPWPFIVSVGFAIVALGIANVAPVTFSASARTPGVAPSVGVAAVTTMGYAGFIVFPPILGFVAKSVGFGWAFAIVILMAAAIVALANVARR